MTAKTDRREDAFDSQRAQIILLESDGSNKLPTRRYTWQPNIPLHRAPSGWDDSGFYAWHSSNRQKSSKTSSQSATCGISYWPQAGGYANTELRTWSKGVWVWVLGERIRIRAKSTCVGHLNSKFSMVCSIVFMVLYPIPEANCQRSRLPALRINLVRLCWVSRPTNRIFYGGAVNHYRITRTLKKRWPNRFKVIHLYWWKKWDTEANFYPFYLHEEKRSILRVVFF